MSLPILAKNKITGKLYINPAKRYVKPYWLQTDPVAVVVAANATSEPISMVVDPTGHFEAFYAVYSSTGAFLINLYDPGRRADLMNRPVHIDTIAGVGQRPFIFPETYFLNVSKGPRQLTATFTDLSGAENTIKFALIGRRFIHPEAPKDIYDRFKAYFESKERSNLYFMTTEDAITSLASAATKKTEFRSPSDSYFEVLKWMAKDVSARTFEVILQEYASGRFLHSTTTVNNTATNAIFGDSAFGNAQYPLILPESYLMERDYRLKVDLKNLHGASAGDFYLTLVGRRLRHLDEDADAAEVKKL